MSDRKLLLGQPKEYPNELIGILKVYLLNISSITETFLAVMYRTQFNSSPEIVIGIKSVNFKAAVQSLMKCTINDDMSSMKINFVDADIEPFKSYFSKIKPFYQKHKAAN